MTGESGSEILKGQPLLPSRGAGASSGMCGVVAATSLHPLPPMIPSRRARPWSWSGPRTTRLTGRCGRGAHGGAQHHSFTRFLAWGCEVFCVMSRRRGVAPSSPLSPPFPPLPLISSPDSRLPSPPPSDPSSPLPLEFLFLSCLGPRHPGAHCGGHHRLPVPVPGQGHGPVRRPAGGAAGSGVNKCEGGGDSPSPTQYQGNIMILSRR